ncbi:MAG: GTPase ObgE [Candidatus Omnitrophica bacterium]|nr:GTPase ObgE [Candidatus Omnitrophota bacterium]
MFIDEAKIYIKAGDGGNGCQSLYRDKYQRRGIPDGGAGGEGASVIAVADKSFITLLDFKYRKHFIGKHGKHGSSNHKKGKNAEDLIMRVPCGTIIKDIKTNCCLVDLAVSGERVILVKGGQGGRGNSHNRPATEGAVGQERDLILELKLIADVGIIGFPNSGKSTLVCAVSKAHSKIASYPFTTKSPVLGVVKGEDFSFTMADIPGLISGSHQGRGLGDRFLRHIERTKLLLHLIDISGLEGRNPIEDYKDINRELFLFNRQLSKRKQIVVANKMDLPGAGDNLSRFRKAVGKRVHAISALNKEGLEGLIEEIRKGLPAHCN